MFKSIKKWMASRNIVSLISTAINADDDFCSNWRQVRIFSNKVGEYWYPQLLYMIVNTLMHEFPNALVFFSRYQSPIDVDSGDTVISKLPDEFKFESLGGRCFHKSIRLRFKAGKSFEKRLQELINSFLGRFWFNSILDYNLVEDLGSQRFSPSTDKGSCKIRAELIARLLMDNCRLIIDSLVENLGEFKFEENFYKDAPAGSSFMSVAHMLVQSWDLYDGNPLPIFYGVRL